MPKCHRNWAYTKIKVLLKYLLLNLVLVGNAVGYWPHCAVKGRSPRSDMVLWEERKNDRLLKLVSHLCLCNTVLQLFSPPGSFTKSRELRDGVTFEAPGNECSFPSAALYCSHFCLKSWWREGFSSFSHQSCIYFSCTDKVDEKLQWGGGYSKAITRTHHN